MTIHYNSISIIPPVIAHRGASLYAPENTLAAFGMAKDLNATWVEFDVMLSLDNEVVVIHDEMLDRTTNGKGFVSEYPYSYLKTLDAGTWFHSKFASERIPTLREVIALLNRLNLSANIEIKAQEGREILTVQSVLQVVQECWKNNISPPLFSSFSFTILEQLRKHCSTCLLGFLMHEWQDDWAAKSDRLNCFSININHEILSLERVKEIKLSNRMLLTYTVNDTKRANELFTWGVDAIFSDDPKSVLAF